MFPNIDGITALFLCQTVRGMRIVKARLRLRPLEKNNSLSWHLRQMPRVFPEGHIMRFFFFYLCLAALNECERVITVV